MRICQLAFDILVEQLGSNREREEYNSEYSLFSRSLKYSCFGHSLNRNIESEVLMKALCQSATNENFSKIFILLYFLIQKMSRNFRPILPSSGQNNIADNVNGEKITYLNERKPQIHFIILISIVVKPQVYKNDFLD